MKILLPVLLLLPTIAFAQDKSPMQQATEAIAMEQMSARQLWQANAIAYETQAKQLKKQFDDANAQVEMLKTANADATKKAADLEAKLDLAAKAQKEQSEGSDKTIRDLKNLLKNEQGRKVACEHDGAK